MKYINQYPISEPGDPIHWYKSNIETYLEKKAQFAVDKEFINEIYNGIASRIDTFTASTTVNCSKGPIQDTMSYDLSFFKLDNGAYELRSFHAKLHSEKGSSHDREHTFGREDKVPVLEDAYHLLDGRAIHYEIATTGKSSFDGWVQFDFNQKKENGNYQTQWFLDNHGFDLRATMKKYPIKEAASRERLDLVIESLKQGELAVVHLHGETHKTHLYVQADPKNKDVIFYDHELKLKPLTRIQSWNLKSIAANGKSSITELKNGVRKTRKSLFVF